MLVKAMPQLLIANAPMATTNTKSSWSEVCVTGKEESEAMGVIKLRKKKIVNNM